MGSSGCPASGSDLIITLSLDKQPANNYLKGLQFLFCPWLMTQLWRRAMRLNTKLGPWLLSENWKVRACELSGLSVLVEYRVVFWEVKENHLILLVFFSWEPWDLEKNDEVSEPHDPFLTIRKNTFFLHISLFIFIQCLSQSFSICIEIVKRM